MDPICLFVDRRISIPLKNIPGELFIAVTGALTLPNPEYVQAVKHGYSTRGKSPEIKLYRINQGWLYLPRGFGPRLVRMLKERGIDYRVEDRRLMLHPVSFDSEIQLRGYQAPAVKSILKYRQGGVVAGCGAGKTEIMLEALARIKQPSLWICHTHELLQQTKERAVEKLRLRHGEIGIIAGGKLQLGKKLTIALIQALNRLDLDKLSSSFGAVFVDEAHHLAARSFYNTVNKFPALYRLWASATPERSDGLTEMIYACAGPVLHKIAQSELPTIIPGLKVIETDFCCHEANYARLMAELIGNEKRNRLVVQAILKEAPGNYSLVLSERVEHLQILKAMLARAAPGLRTGILTGKVPKTNREKVMLDVQARRVDVLFATQLAREGLDVAHLNRLFLATPKRAAGALEQEIGRIMRPSVGKSNAFVYDFWDVHTPILKAQFWPRREIYRKLGMQFNPAFVDKRRASV